MKRLIRECASTLTLHKEFLITTDRKGIIYIVVTAMPQGRRKPVKRYKLPLRPQPLEDFDPRNSLRLGFLNFLIPLIAALTLYYNLAGGFTFTLIPLGTSGLLFIFLIMFIRFIINSFPTSRRHEEQEKKDHYWTSLRSVIIGDLRQINFEVQGVKVGHTTPGLVLRTNGTLETPAIPVIEVYLRHPEQENVLRLFFDPTEVTVDPNSAYRYARLPSLRLLPRYETPHHPFDAVDRLKLYGDFPELKDMEGVTFMRADCESDDDSMVASDNQLVAA